MDLSYLAKLGGIVGAIAAVGGLVVAILSYVAGNEESSKGETSTPIEISILTNDPVSQAVLARVDRFEGRWIAHPLEIYTDVSAGWLAREGSGAAIYYDATVIDASVLLERAERKDELIATIRLQNDVFDHRFRGIAKVSTDDIRLLQVRHLKQYGAEPNLKVSMARMEIVDSGALYVEMTMPGFMEVSFFADPDGDVINR